MKATNLKAKHNIKSAIASRGISNIIVKSTERKKVSVPSFPYLLAAMTESLFLMYIMLPKVIIISSLRINTTGITRGIFSAN